MILRECPVCHQKAAYANNTPYCPHCGWNRDAAVSAMKMSLNAIPVAIFMFAGLAAFMYWGMKFDRAPQLMIFILFPAAFIPFSYIWLKRKIAKLEAMQFSKNSRPAPSASADTAFGATSTPPAPQYSPNAPDEALLNLPAPRQIRLAKSSRWFKWVVGLALASVFVVVLVNLYQDWEKTSSFAGMGRRDMILTGVFAGLVLLAASIWRSQMRECDLLEHGEVVMGTVVRQWSDQKQGSQVEYEFTDFLGQTHRAVAFDRALRFYSGMAVPVFYDRDNPKRHIAYCAALHEIILPAAPSASNIDELTAAR